MFVIAMSERMTIAMGLGFYWWVMDYVVLSAEWAGSDGVLFGGGAEVMSVCSQCK